MHKYLILTVLLASSITVNADVPDKQKAEVSHLLSFVKNSKCIITRNGDMHTGEKALSHIQKKYDYYKDDIKSTEDFIKYSATKSMMSGKYYTVSCDGKKMIKTKDWLLDELKKYREAALDKKNKVTVCTEPRPQICTMEYVPVCAKHKDGSLKTYSTGCTACSNADIVSYKMGDC